MWRAGANLAVDGLGLVRPTDAGVLHRDLVRIFQALGRLRGECGGAFADGGQSIHIHGRAFFGQTVKQFAGGLTAGQFDGQGSDDRAIVQTLADLEHVGAGGRVARPNRTLGGSGATPLRQVGEMQVVPAHGHCVEYVLRQDIAIGDDRGDIRMQVVQRFHEFGGAGFEIDDGQPEFQSRRLDRAGRELAAAAGRRVGAGDDAYHIKTWIGGKGLE